jgi:hypothetical protein
MPAQKTLVNKRQKPLLTGINDPGRLEIGTVMHSAGEPTLNLIMQVTVRLKGSTAHK